MRKIREVWQRSLLRPTIYMTFTRLALGLCAALLADHFLSARAGRDLRGLLFLLLAVLFALLAWLAFLRLDGVRMPRWLSLRPSLQKKPPRGGDLIDWVDEEPGPAFSELEDREKDLCLLIARVVCSALAAVGAAVLPG